MALGFSILMVKRGSPGMAFKMKKMIREIRKKMGINSRNLINKYLLKTQEPPCD
jgi:hypothetical protein